MGRFLRRLFRFAFHLAAGVSALALVACLILWPLSYRRRMGLGYVTSSHAACSLRVDEGRLWAHYNFVSWRRRGFVCQFDPLNPGSPPDWFYTDWRHEEPEASGTYDYALGGTWFRSDIGSILAIPLLYPTLLSAVLPAFWLRWFRRERQARRARPGFPVEPAAPAR